MWELDTVKSSDSERKNLDSRTHPQPMNIHEERSEFRQDDSLEVLKVRKPEERAESDVALNQTCTQRLTDGMNQDEDFALYPETMQGMLEDVVTEHSSPEVETVFMRLSKTTDPTPAETGNPTHGGESRDATHDKPQAWGHGHGLSLVSPSSVEFFLLRRGVYRNSKSRASACVWMRRTSHDCWDPGGVFQELVKS